MIYPESKVIVLHALFNNLTIENMLKSLKRYCRYDCTKIYVEEECGFTGYAFSDCNSALFDLFESMDGSILVKDLSLDIFAVALVFHGDKMFYRFRKGRKHGVTCRFENILDDFDWIDQDWVLIKNHDGVFIERRYMKSSE